MTRCVDDDWAALIPHRGAMSLLDTIVAWDESSIHARSGSHRRPDHPLRSAHGLHVVHLIEYAAQASAVHGALRAQSQGQPPLAAGRLVSLREIWLGTEWVDAIDGCMDIHVVQLMGGRDGAHYDFRVTAGDALLVSGRLAVMYGAAD